MVSWIDMRVTDTAPQSGLTIVRADTVQCQGPSAAQEESVWRPQYRGDSRAPCPLSGDAAAYDDGLHLPPGLCDSRVSWHAYCVARAPSCHLLLAHLHTSRAPGTQNVGRDGEVDACDHH